MRINTKPLACAGEGNLSQSNRRVSLAQGDGADAVSPAPCTQACSAACQRWGGMAMGRERGVMLGTVSLGAPSPSHGTAAAPRRRVRHGRPRGPAQTGTCLPLPTAKLFGTPSPGPCNCTLSPQPAMLPSSLQQSGPLPAKPAPFQKGATDRETQKSPTVVSLPQPLPGVTWPRTVLWVPNL